MTESEPASDSAIGVADVARDAHHRDAHSFARRFCSLNECRL